MQEGDCKGLWGLKQEEILQCYMKKRDLPKMLYIHVYIHLCAYIHTHILHRGRERKKSGRL